jgi:hypothetical protein
MTSPGVPKQVQTFVFFCAFIHNRFTLLFAQVLREETIEQTIWLLKQQLDHVVYPHYADLGMLRCIERPHFLARHSFIFFFP